MKLELSKEFGTKADLAILQAVLEKKIIEVKSELKQDIAEVRTEISSLP